MSEPKYPIGTWVEHEDGYLVEIVAILDPALDGNPCYGVALGGHILYKECMYESQIKNAIRIIPIVDKPKCKDCQFWNEHHQCRDNQCPIVKWVHLQYAITEGVYDDTAEPPDGSACFRPKVGHEQQEAK